MSLLDDFAKTCTVLEQRRVEDGEGGYTLEWSDGQQFRNFFTLDTSMQTRRAEKDGVTSLYSALVEQDCAIRFGDFFRDEETGLTYRVTSIPEEKKAPQSASAFLQLKYFTAERKELPA